MKTIFKIAGVLITVLSISLYGFLKSFNLKKYISRLENTQKALHKADDMLRLGADSSSQIINECFKNDNILPMFFFNEFGNGDLELERQKVARMINHIGSIKKEQEEKYAQNSKIWRTGGICAGLIIGIMLF